MRVPTPEVPTNVAGLRTVSSYHLISEILRSPAFGNGRSDIARMRGTLPAIDGHDHLERRRLESRLFTPEAIERYEREILVVQLDRFVQRCRDTVEPGSAFRGDLAQLSLSWLTQVAARIAGVDGIDDDDSAGRLRELTEGPVAEYAKVSAEEQLAIERASDERTRRFNDEMLEPSVERRRKLLAQVGAGTVNRTELPSDVLTLLLEHREPSWDDELVLREVAVFLAGSIRTTARSLVHLTGHLDVWFAEHPEDLELRTEPAFLRAAANEVLRLHPVLPVLLRDAARRVELSDGSVIDASERVALLFGTANRDADVFGAEPDAFNPRRDGLTGVPGYGLAFAAGAHTCIGRRLAMGTGADREAGGTMGSLLTMTLRLQTMDVRTDPEERAVYDDTTFYDEYERFPILCDPWRDGAVAGPCARTGAMP